MDLVPGSFFTEGRFGRMFRNLPQPEGPPDQLAALAATMIAQPERRDIDPVPTPEPANEHENQIIPAGYTYLGQFVDHDITFDPVSSLQRQNDPPRPAGLPYSRPRSRLAVRARPRRPAVPVSQRAEAGPARRARIRSPAWPPRSSA
jgi:hypothetical protein